MRPQTCWAPVRRAEWLVLWAAPDALEKSTGYLFSAPRRRMYRNACYFVEQSGGHLSTTKIFEYSFDFTDHALWDSFQSSGGLMCAYSNQSCCFRVFNPHIAEEVQVPRDPKFKRWLLHGFIFSYSPSIKEYKIIKHGLLIKEGLVSETTVAEICTLGSNIWREIQNVPSHFGDYVHIRCQGNPFWMKDSDLHFFDLVSEKFHVIPGPPGLDQAQLYDHNTCYYFMSGNLISMGDTVGYLHNYRLWVLKDKTQGTWINKYNFSIPPLDEFARPLGTWENGHLFGYMTDSKNVFSHDMGCTGFRIFTEMNYADLDEEQLKRRVYIAPHVRSFVSPVRIMNMGKRLNHKRNRVLDRLKLDYDATEDDLFNRMYEFMEAYEKTDTKAKTYN